MVRYSGFMGLWRTRCAFNCAVTADIDLSQPGIARCLRDYANGGEGVFPRLPAIGYDWGARCSSSCTRAPARPCSGRARRTPPTITTLGTRMEFSVHAGVQSPQTAKQMIKREERMNAGR